MKQVFIGETVGFHSHLSGPNSFIQFLPPIIDTNATKCIHIDKRSQRFLADKLVRLIDLGHQKGNFYRFCTNFTLFGVTYNICVRIEIYTERFSPVHCASVPLVMSVPVKLRGILLLSTVWMHDPAGAGEENFATYQLSNGEY